LRVVIQEDELIVDNKYIFTDVDAYYHLLQADYIYDNYPEVERFSSLLYFPDGQVVGQRPSIWIYQTDTIYVYQSV
jgi:asparagine N-glycosylation enzyme membrane subunit Stt3